MRRGAHCQSEGGALGFALDVFRPEYLPVTPHFRSALLAATFVFGLVQPGILAAGSLAGAYLAAQQANYDNDYRQAAIYYTRALEQDPENLDLMQNALLALIARGDVAASVKIADQMEAMNAGSQLAQLVVLTEAIRVGDFDKANAMFEAGATFSPLLDGLIRGWIYLGQGRMSDATAEFDTLSANEAMQLFSTYHRALTLAVVGDYESAAGLLANDGSPIRIGRGSLIAEIEALSQLERPGDAIAVIDDALNASGDLQLLDMRERLVAGEVLLFDVARNATEGAGEVFVTLASVLAGEDNDRFGLIYGRLAEHLRPDATEAILLVAEMLNAQKQYDLAVENLDKVPTDSPAFYSAEIGRAQALQAADKTDAAIEVLRALSKTYSDIPSVFSALGDAYRRVSDFAGASAAYAEAINLLPDPQPGHWFLYYARGISYEREGKWDEAVADFRFALKLSPDQPLVLNYLGYGMIEKRINFDEAQMMIEKAVEKRPNDGYITDSLGWVLYRIGKFDEAVAHMERAVELMPVDPIINDHLGDVYWMVDRKLEARFQWRRALSFGPEPAEADRIRRKLDIGLDEVLKMEAAAGQNGD